VWHAAWHACAGGAPRGVRCQLREQHRQAQAAGAAPGAELGREVCLVDAGERNVRVRERGCGPRRCEALGRDVQHLEAPCSRGGQRRLQAAGVSEASEAAAVSEAAARARQRESRDSGDAHGGGPLEVPPEAEACRHGAS
jgi:hypothetical protein